MNFADELYAHIPESVPPRPKPLPLAWQATADNKVDRQFASAADKAAYEQNEKFRAADTSLRTLQAHLTTAKTSINALEQQVRNLCHDLHAPGSELATAQDALVHLQRRNESLIKECQRQNKRADEAEAKLAELQTCKPEDLAALDTAAEPVPAVVFLRRTPGDAIRYLAGEVMKHAEDNPFLSGSAIALRMVADDVDNLPQGDHAR